MSDTRILYRPTGIHEMALIVSSGLREFPPRLAHQPIFYPVLTYEYAVQIARDWNAKDSSGHAGFVTQFAVDTAYAGTFEEHVVGSAQIHREFWVPAEDLADFNRHIIGIITPIKAFYGEGYAGPIARTGLANIDPHGQFVRLDARRDDTMVDFMLDIQTNWDVVLLNFEFWAERDFAPDGISPERRDETLRDVLIAWRAIRGKPPIPDCGPVGADRFSTP